MTKDYKVIRVLGKGGMSVVYLAEHVEFHTLWAVKQVHKQEEPLFDILAEPNILKELSHPMLPLIMDIIEDDKDIYVIEEYIEGRDLKEYSKEHGPVDEEKVIGWFSDLCDVLGYLHNQKPNPIIYRDLKPANIMLRPDDRLALVDFGIARRYKEGSSGDTTLAGTRGFAAPEQFSRDIQTDARSDIYSLGVTMYQMVTGKSPYEPPYEIQPIRDINPKLSEGLEHILLKCTRLNPEDRYQSVKELKEDLLHVKEIRPRAEAEKKKKRKKYIAAAALVVILGLAGVLGYQQYTRIQQKKAAQEAMMNRACESGQTKMEAGDYEEAVQDFQHALDIDEDYLPGLEGKLDAWLAIGEKAESPEDTEEALKNAKALSERLEALGQEISETRSGNLDELEELLTFRKQYQEIGDQLLEAFENQDYDKAENVLVDDKYNDALQDLNNKLAQDNSYYLVSSKEGKTLAIYKYAFIYYGDWKDGKRTGKGIWYYTDKEKTYWYEGKFSGDKPNGKGTFHIYQKKSDSKEEIYPVEQRWKGSFKDGYYSGTFMIFWRMNNDSTRNFTPVHYKKGKADALSPEDLYEHDLEYGYPPAQAAQNALEEAQEWQDTEYIAIATCKDSLNRVYVLHENKDSVNTIPGF